jgi:hypothetical protein
MGIGFGAFMQPVKVGSEEGWKTSLKAECETERCSLDGTVVARVISKSEGRNKKFPIGGAFIDKRRKILGNSFVTHLGLAVTLRVVTSGGRVVNVQCLEEVLRHFVGEFFALVSNEF